MAVLTSAMAALTRFGLASSSSRFFNRSLPRRCHLSLALRRWASRRRFSSLSFLCLALSFTACVGPKARSDRLSVCNALADGKLPV